VADVAVIGSDDDFGEQVKAPVQPVSRVSAGDALAAELVSYCREHLAGFKCPRSVEFMKLSRGPTGKLRKRRLRERYWTGHPARII
jgi:long-chain acyl-CoA synthetase